MPDALPGSIPLAEIDTGNSTTTPLGISGVFTGTSKDVSEYLAVQLQVFADEDAATLGVSVQTSIDNVVWTDHAHSYDYTSGNEGHFSFSLPAQYYRVVYTNGLTGQGAFRLQAKLSKVAAQDHAHPIDFGLSIKHPATVTRSVITGETTAGGGGLVNVKVGPSGVLQTEVGNGLADPVPVRSVNDNSLALRSPLLTGSLSMIPGDYVHKFEVTNALDRNGGSGILQQATFLNVANLTSVDLALWIFADDPTVASASGAPLDISDAEMEKWLFKLIIRSGSAGAHTQGLAFQAGQQGILVTNEESTPGTSIWVVVQSLTTFTTATDQFKYRIGVVPT